jgi:hypothetical protein
MLMNMDIKLRATCHGLTIVVESRLCQLYDRDLCMIGSSSILLSLSMI